MNGSIAGWSAALAVTLAAAPARAQPIVDGAGPAVARVLIGPRASLGTSLMTGGYSFTGGARRDPFSLQHVEARWLFGGFTLEGGLLGAVPIGSAAAGSLTAHLRIGWSWRRATVAAGASAQFAPTTPATQLLPTLTAAYAFDRFGLSAGVFDLHALSLARLSFEHQYFGVGYLAPLGIEAHGRLPVTRAISLRAQAFAFRAFNADVAFVGLSAVFEPELLSARAGSAP